MNSSCTSWAWSGAAKFVREILSCVYRKCRLTQDAPLLEVDGNQLREVVLQEGVPGLRRRPAAAHHVFTHAALPDIDAEFEQLTMDAWCAPSGIFTAHPTDQVADFEGKRGSSRLAAPNLPRPEETKPPAMPGYHRLRLNDGQRRAPVAPDAEQPDS